LLEIFPQAIDLLLVQSGTTPTARRLRAPPLAASARYENAGVGRGLFMLPPIPPDEVEAKLDGWVRGSANTRALRAAG
jgi:hypothetical protein